jgi:ABC-type transport system substrate-binding protein
VASEEAGTVSRIDPRSGEVVRAIHVGNGPSAVAVGEGAVWALNRQDGTISRIDPATDAVSWTVGLGGEPLAVAAGDGAVWVAGGAAGTITRVDPRAPDILQRVEVGGSPAGITVTDGEVWATAAAPRAAHHGGTLRVRYTSDPPNALPIDWLKPAGHNWATAQLTSLAYDGLVGYRRVGGAAGGTVVGALATNAPQPSRDGRTYVFTLRTGLRYSDGRPVRAGDFRASMERFLRVTGDTLPPSYAGIVGAQRCVAHPVRCDLSAGIETDETTRTIAVHLTRPDAEFLHKLTSQFAYVVPANTPLRLTAGRAPPGTGPYRFAAWDVDRGGHLIRNRHFRSASPESRPPGFADRIEVDVRRPAEIEAQVADVRNGTADLAVLVEPFKSRLGPKRLSALAAQSPGQVHSRPVAATEYMFLNVRRSPFDDLRVRRALNYATDRERLVALEGGPEVASPTCQIIPVGFPGYKPYCPYTAAPAPGRGWTSPRLKRARRLVARSATAGERVVVHVPESKREVGRYFAALLDDLGYDTSRRVVPDDDYVPTIYDPRTRAQIGFIGWSSDHATPSNFIQPNFTCASPASRRPENASYFCNRALARRVDRALGVGGAEGAARWAAIDRRLADLAPAVPLNNRRSVVLVSRRVGDVQQHIQTLTLLDRLWVR